MSNIRDIIKLYEDGELTLEAVNKRLLEEGAGFSLKPLTEDERAAKATKEYEEGTIDIGREPAVDLPAKPDMRRRTDLAGQTVVQETRAGRYEVEYKEDGYARSAKRL